MTERKMKFSVEKVLETLKKNAATHKAEYETLVVKNFFHVKEELEKALGDMAKPDATMPDFSGLRAAQNSKPTDHSADYERFISYLAATSETQVELTEYEFDQYMNDNWTWKRDFLSNKATYGMH